MRGKVFRRPNKDNPQGITPAYAGKSRRQNTQCVAIRDHPRLCGEKGGGGHRGDIIEGSPPPMRGKG